MVQFTSVNSNPFIAINLLCEPLLSEMEACQSKITGQFRLVAILDTDE